MKRVAPAKVRKEAKLGLLLHKKWKRGGTAVGVARAVQLYSGKAVSDQTIKRMYSYFQRHQHDRLDQDGSDGKAPSRGYIAWLLWGGDSGRKWAESEYRKIKKRNPVKRMNPAIQITNIERIKDFIEDLIKEATGNYVGGLLKTFEEDEKLKDWFRKNLYNAIIKIEETDQLQAFDGQIFERLEVLEGEYYPEWVEKVFNEGKPLYDFVYNPDSEIYVKKYFEVLAGIDFDHFLDFYMSEDFPKNVSRVSLKQMQDLVRKWDEKNSKIELKKLNGKEETVYKEYPDGFKWVQIHSRNALLNESSGMGGICIGTSSSHSEPILKGEHKAFSLRDKEGLPKVTAEYIFKQSRYGAKNTFREIKGYKNSNYRDYGKYVADLINTMPDHSLNYHINDFAFEFSNLLKIRADEKSKLYEINDFAKFQQSSERLEDFEIDSDIKIYSPARHDRKFYNWASIMPTKKLICNSLHVEYPQAPDFKLPEHLNCKNGDAQFYPYPSEGDARFLVELPTTIRASEDILFERLKITKEPQTIIARGIDIEGVHFPKLPSTIMATEIDINGLSLDEAPKEGALVNVPYIIFHSEDPILKYIDVAKLSDKSKVSYLTSGKYGLGDTTKGGEVLTQSNIISSERDFIRPPYIGKIFYGEEKKQNPRKKKNPLKDWPNEWVRFTDYEDLTIAKQPYHMDPAGLYFFPKSFQQMGVWHTENKYVVTIRLKPEAKVLDLGGISETEMRDILNKLNIQYKDDKKIDPYKFWMKIRENYIGKQVKFSNELRKIGYDAVFDDTKSIHGVEKQLLVLRPKYIEVLSVKKVAKFTDILREMDKVVRNEFSGWSATKAEIKNKTQWGEKTKVLAYELSKGKLKIEVEITHSAIRSRSKEKIPSDVTARFYVGGKNNYDQSWDRDLIKFSLSGNSKYDSQKEKLFVEIYNYNLDDFKLKIKKLNEITSEKDHSIYTDKEGKHWGQQGAGGLFYCPATGRYLVSHRSLLVNEPNTWGTWGGKIDENESPEEALKREIKEETGYKGTYSLKHIYTYTDNDFKFYNYIIEVPEEFEPNHSWETQGHEWVTLNDMPQPMHYGLKALIPYLAKKQNPTKEENPVSSIEGHKFVSTKTIQNYGYRFLLRQSFQRPIVRQETFINIKNNKKEIIEKFKNSLENSEYELDPYANLLFNIFGKKDFYPKKGTPQFRKVYGHYSVSDFDKLNKEDKEEIVKYIKEFIDEIENPNKKINLKEDKHLHIKILDPQFFYEIYGIDFLNQLKNTEKIEINGTNRKVQHDLVEVCIAEEEWRLAILKRKFERFSKLLSKKQNPLSLIAKGFDERPASSYDREELKKGIKTELEHTDDAIIASKIAKDHLDEDPHYYTKLLKMENPLGVRDYHPSKDEIATYNAAYSKWIEDCYSEIKKFCEKYKLWYKVHRPRAGYSHYIAIYKNSVASVDEPNLPYYPLAIRLSTHPEKRPYTEYKDFDLSLVFKIDPKGDFSADYHDDNNQLKKDYVSTNSTKELHKFLWGIDMYERKKQYKKANPDSINLVKEYQKYVEILLKDYIDTHLIAEGVDKDPENFKRLVKEKKESYVPKLSFILDVVVYGHSDNFINLLIDAVEENTTELSNILTSFDKDFVEFIKSRGEDVFYREANKNLKIYIYEHDGDTDIKSEKYLSIGTDFIKFIKYLMDSGKIRDTRKLLNPITSVSKKSKVKMWSRMKKHNPYGKCNCFSCSRKKEQNDNGDISIENLERLIEESRRIIKALELKRESAREERDSYKYLWNDRGNERDYDKAEELDEKVQEYYYSIEFEKSRLEDFLERLKVKKSNPVTSNSEKSEEYLPVIQETVAGIDKGLDVWIDEKNNDIVIGTMAFEEDRSFDDILVRIKTNGRIIEGEDVDNSIKKYTQNLMKKVHKDLAEYVTKKPNPSKFQKLVKKLETKGAEDPKALAAWIGRQKYGEKKFQQMAEKGKKKIQAKRK